MAAINQKYVPKFNYREIETTTTEIGRLYHSPIGDMSSLTTMLSATKDMSGLEEWRDRIGHEKADQIMNDAGEKGTCVHDLMEQYLRGNDVGKLLNGAAEHVVAGYHSLRLYSKHITEIWGLEVPVYDAELQIAGRVDIVGCWRHRPAIIDWKTSRWPKKPEHIIDYKLQLLFYALAHNQMFGTDIRYGVILIAVENDLPQKFEVDFDDADDLYIILAQRIQQYRGTEHHEKLLHHITSLPKSLT